LKSLSPKVTRFTESVIRMMTHVCDRHGGINLAQGFPDFACPTELKEAAKAAIDADINQYAITWGARDFRHAIAAKTERFYPGWRVDPETYITVTCGATEGMIAAFLAVLGMTTLPGFLLTDFYDIAIAGGEPTTESIPPGRGGVILEAEEAQSHNGTVIRDEGTVGATGDGYLRLGDPEGVAFVEWGYDAPDEGLYLLELRYALRSGVIPVDLRVNGEPIDAFALWTTGLETTWAWTSRPTMTSHSPVLPRIVGALCAAAASATVAMLARRSSSSSSTAAICPKTSS
jgi:hypothetical protein